MTPTTDTAPLADSRQVPQAPDAQAPGQGSAADPADPTPPLPRFAQFEPVGRCNLACRMCAVNERTDAVGELTLEQFRALLDGLPGLEHLHLQGLGEPMLHPQFFEMVELAAARGLWVSANTNLTLLTEARAERCATSGLAALSVSLDGATAPVYETVRRQANFAKVLRNLGRLTAARDRHRSGGRELSVRGVMVLMRCNLHHLPALVRLLHAHGVHELQVQRLANEADVNGAPAAVIPIQLHNALAELRPADLPLAEAVFHRARRTADALGLRLQLPRLTPPPRPAGMPGRQRCDWPWQQTYITGAGQMLPCCMVATADRASFGSVFAADGSVGDLRAAWHSAAAQDFRRALAGGAPPAVCRGCALYHGRF